MLFSEEGILTNVPPWITLKAFIIALSGLLAAQSLFSNPHPPRLQKDYR